MPTFLVKRIDLDQLYPPFVEKLLNLLAKCHEEGAWYYCLTGYRAPTEQAKLYFQGRTTPGPRVTNAKPGYSLHQYGIACDVARDLDFTKAGLQPDWSTEGYQRLHDESEAFGLQVGVPFPQDAGHIQLPVKQKFKAAKEIDVLRVLKRIHDAEGMSAVWKHLDSVGPW